MLTLFRNNPVTPVAAATLSITSGGTAQTVFAANKGGYEFEFQNQSTGDLYISTAGTAALGTGFKVAAGQFYSSSGKRIYTALSVWGATTAQNFYAEQW